MLITSASRSGNSALPWSGEAVYLHRHLSLAGYIYSLLLISWELFGKNWKNPIVNFLWIAVFHISVLTVLRGLLSIFPWKVRKLFRPDLFRSDRFHVAPLIPIADFGRFFTAKLLLVHSFLTDWSVFSFLCVLPSSFSTAGKCIVFFRSHDRRCSCAALHHVVAAGCARNLAV